MPSLRGAPGGVGRAHRRGRHVATSARKFRLSLGQIASGRGRHASPRAARGDAAPAPGTSTSARATPRPRARRAGDPADAALCVGRPRAARPPARDPRLDLRLPAPPRPRAHRVGLRAGGRAHPGPQGAVRRAVGHRQDDGRRGDRRTSSASTLYRIDLSHGRQQVHRRDREEPRPHLRGGRRTRNAILFFDEADALFGKRSEVQRRPRPLRQHRGRLPAAADGELRRRWSILATNLAPEHRRRVRAPARLRDRLPVPRGRGPQADLAAAAARRRRRSTTTSTSRSSPTQFKLSGGAIRNCSLAAAFWPPTRARRSRMPHLVRGVALEFGKQGRLTLETDFEQFHELIRPGRAQASRRPTPRTSRAPASSDGASSAPGNTSRIASRSRVPSSSEQQRARRLVGDPHDLIAQRRHDRTRFGLRPRPARLRAGADRRPAAAGRRHDMERDRPGVEALDQRLGQRVRVRAEPLAQRRERDRAVTSAARIASGASSLSSATNSCCTAARSTRGAGARSA